jgi:hypothetical protein
MPDRSYLEVKEAALQTVALQKLPGRMSQLTRSVRVMTLAVLMLQGTELAAALRLLQALEAAVDEAEASAGQEGEPATASADLPHLLGWPNLVLRPISWRLLALRHDVAPVRENVPRI